MDGKYFVEYSFRLPIQEGIYSIQTQLSIPIIINQKAEFINVIDDAIVFKINERNHARLWTKVFIPSQYKVIKI